MVMSQLIYNKKAGFDYEFLDKYEAGIELLGLEVKSLRAKHGVLEGSRVIIRGGEAYLIGASIPPYQPGNTPKEYEPDRNRRLLLTKKEIASLSGVEGQKGLTIVPISVYNKGNKIKIEIAVAKGKKKFDKRETIRKRDVERDIAREMSIRD
jgi:SsrA-binding protein